MKSSNQGSIGVFDSGVGGLSVLQKVIEALPEEKFIYLADQIHVPYGERSLKEVRQFSFGILRFLLNQGAKLIVVACNTASAAALHSLRKDYPDVPIVGMEPAVKPAAEYSHTRKVGVLATPATFQGELYASVVERFAQDVKIFQHTCPGLVGQIERGELSSSSTRKILQSVLNPMLAEGIDTVVLGCTHYPLVLPIIQEIVGEDVRVIDPAPAIAGRVKFLLNEENIMNTGSHAHNLVLYTTGNTTAFEKSIEIFLNKHVAVKQLSWDQLNNTLNLSER